MKNLKITGVLLLLTSFMACKKDKVTPESVEEPFEIKQYVLVTKNTNINGWVTNIDLTSFEAQNQCRIFTELSEIPDKGFTYKFENGLLQLFYDGRLKNEITIENNTIKSTTDNTPGVSFKLIKIPKDNPFNGNTYAGGWKTEGSNLTYVASLKFTDTHYSEASINLPEPNKTYDLIKYIAVRDHDAVKNVYTLWVMIDEKLEGYRSTYNNNVRNRVTGTFTKK